MLRISLLLLLFLICRSTGLSAAEFRVGFAEADITPPAGLPMWGYGARHAMLSEGAIDPLFARAVVIDVGADKAAIVGLDLGRGPTAPMMTQIRETVLKQAGIQHVLISGSHTHHGPVIELTDKPGFGKGRFDKAVTYSQELPGMLSDVILAAAAAAEPAQIGVGVRDDLNLNRNRQAKREPKARDTRLSVMRFDRADGSPIAVLVNFAAHPVMADTQVLKYSADYPGVMARAVSEQLQAGCVFMQGASGDLSVNPPDGIKGPEQFGRHLAEQVLQVAADISTSVPEKPSVAGRQNHFLFRSRVDFNSVLVRLAYSAAFFPELMANATEEFSAGIPGELNTVVINGNVALVGGNGEFFCNHAIRLRERSYVDHTLFFGYCNGHSLYFPTIEAASEGGYGADKEVSPAEVGAGEQMLNQALMNIYDLLGRYEPALPQD